MQEVALDNELLAAALPAVQGQAGRGDGPHQAHPAGVRTDARGAAARPRPAEAASGGAERKLVAGAADASAAPVGRVPSAAEAERQCRICHAGGSGLFSPCLCKGSQQWVHESCLQEWRVKSSRADSYHTCELCQYQYTVARPWWATALGHPRAQSLLTLVWLMRRPMRLVRAARSNARARAHDVRARGAGARGAVHFDWACRLGRMDEIFCRRVPRA